MMANPSRIDRTRPWPARLRALRLVPKRCAAAMLLPLACVVSAPAAAQAVPGKPAPPFALADLGGKPVSLADFRGRTVVLEWNNASCPFVRKHYESGNMQALQKAAAREGVVWVSIDSTARGHQDYMAPPAKAAWVAEQRAEPFATLLDTEGVVGRAYGARTTPHMYIIDGKGTLVYAGAIDSIKSANPADIRAATNYVRQALDELRAGRPVSVASTVPYGCSVKYD